MSTFFDRMASRKTLNVVQCILKISINDLLCNPIAANERTLITGRRNIPSERMAGAEYPIYIIIVIRGGDRRTSGNDMMHAPVDPLL